MMIKIITILHFLKVIVCDEFYEDYVESYYDSESDAHDSYGYNDDWQYVDYAYYDSSYQNDEYNDPYEPTARFLIPMDFGPKPEPSTCYDKKIYRYHNFPEFFLADNDNVILGLIQRTSNGIMYVQGKVGNLYIYIF